MTEKQIQELFSKLKDSITLCSDLANRLKKEAVENGYDLALLIVEHKRDLEKISSDYKNRAIACSGEVLRLSEDLAKFITSHTEKFDALEKSLRDYVNHEDQDYVKIRHEEAKKSDESKILVTRIDQLAATLDVVKKELIEEKKSNLELKKRISELERVTPTPPPQTLPPKMLQESKSRRGRKPAEKTAEPSPKPKVANLKPAEHSPKPSEFQGEGRGAKKKPEAVDGVLAVAPKLE